MTNEFDKLVRDSMSWFTDGLEVPAGLADRARRHHRQRQRRKAGWLAAGTATVGAAAVILATAATGQVVPPRTGTGPIKARTTAEIVSRVSQALAATQASDPIEDIRWTLGQMGGAILLPVPKNLGAESVSAWETWSHGRVLEENYIGSSRHVVARDHVVFGSRISVTFFDYKYRIWRHTMRLPLDPSVMHPFRPYCDFDPLERTLTVAQWSSEVRKLLSCGTVTNAGYQRVDGVNAIKLVVHPVPVRVCDYSVTHGRCKRWAMLPGNGSTIWVSRATFMPVAMTNGQIRLDFRWLPPSQANLALLQQAIPPGFRYVPGTIGYGY